MSELNIFVPFQICNRRWLANSKRKQRRGKSYRISHKLDFRFQISCIILLPKASGGEDYHMDAVQVVGELLKDT